jgi:putative copper export protein
MGLASMGRLVLTGVINAWVQVGPVPALLGTAYGRWLGLKVALLGPLLAIAGVNHLVLKSVPARRAVLSRPPGPSATRVQRAARGRSPSSPFGISRACGST